MLHQHIYDQDGKQLCCNQEEKINKVVDSRLKHGCSSCSTDQYDHNYTGDDGDDHSGGGQSTFSLFFPSIISFVLL